PDWVIARPVFDAGRLVAFACNRAHQSDIGGGAAGTYNPQATEIFHEGIRLPPLKLIEAGRTREDLWQLLCLNSRTPELIDGDLPRNEGTFRAVRIVAPEGTVVNAKPPAALTMCTVFPAQEIMHMVWNALGDAAPARAVAGWGKNAFPVSSGRDGDGDTWVM